jgi:single-strand DNA-binding protein
MNVNKVFVGGRLCADPQLRYLPSNSAVVNFRMVTNRKWKSEKGEERDEATFWEIVAFGKLAELINQYFAKGQEIFIEGRGRLEQWEDKQTGQKRSKMVVVAETFQFVGSAKGDGSGGGGKQTAKEPFGEEVQFTDADVPF